MLCPKCGEEMVCNTYKTTSKWGKAGEPKMVNVFDQIPANADNWEAEYQLNRYRVMLEELGVKVTAMQLQVTVRDGGLAIATSRGLFRNVYLIPVKFIPNEEVKSYFTFKNMSLMKALEFGWTEPCLPHECWEGRRCEKFCDVKMFCPKGRLVQRLDNREGDNA